MAFGRINAHGAVVAPGVAGQGQRTERVSGLVFLAWEKLPTAWGPVKWGIAEVT